MIIHDLQVLPSELLNVSEVVRLGVVAEGNRDALPSCAPRATDAVDVALRDVRQVVVEHVAHAVHVDATRGDVCRDQDAECPVLKARQRTRPGALRLVPVDGGRTDAHLVQILDHPVRTVLGPSEDDGTFDGRILKEVLEQALLIRPLHEHDLLNDLLDGGGLPIDLHLDGVTQEPTGEAHDGLGHRGREQQILALARKQLQHTPDVVNEAHIEHAVRLIQHEELHASEVDEPLPVKVEQAARCRHQDVHPATQIGDLRPLVDAAKDDPMADLEVGTVGLKIVPNLRSQLTRGRQHQRPNDGLPAAGLCRDLLQGGEQEGRGLTRSRLCASEDVPARKQGRYGCRLNGGGLGVFLLSEGSLNRLDEVELVKAIHMSSGFGVRALSAISPSRQN